MCSRCCTDRRPHPTIRAEPKKNLSAWAARIALTFAVLMAGAPAPAQECPSADRHRLSNRVPLIRNMVDPNPIDADFVLPMPCGGKLLLRHVCVPSSGFLDDFRFEAGCNDCGRKTSGFMEARRPVHLAGAFSRADLPATWRQTLEDLHEQEDGACTGPGDSAETPRYYFIGKYEISAFQWDAVMEGDCPGWDRLVTPDDPRPKTDISWFEAVTFTRRYTEWLLDEHPKALPRFSDGRYAHLRLPTEAEWEYAARGGHRVTAEQLNREAFFPLNGRPLSDYAVYTAVNAPKPPDKIAWIGSKCANPLGVFDTAGNAAEMILEPFRFSVDGRRHGAAGGFLVKGGSFRKRQSEILPGRREEMPYFLENGAFRNADIGFRVVLSGIVVPRERIEPLRSEWARRAPQKELTRTANAPTEDDAAFSGATGGLRTAASGVQASLWQALFSAEAILTQANKVERLQDDLDKLESLSGMAIPELELKSLHMRRKRLTEALAREQAATNRFLMAYLSALQALQTTPPALLADQMERLLGSYPGEPSENASLKRRLKMLQRHVRSVPQRTSLSEQYRILQQMISILASERE